jgi:hypothetical protein
MPASRDSEPSPKKMKDASTFWVNRTSQNLKLRTTAEDTAIRKHVQSWRRQTATQKTRKYRRLPAKHPDGTTSRPGSARETSTPESDASSSDASLPSDTSIDVTRDSSPEPPVLALSAVFEGASDPFSSTALPMSSANVDLLQHCQRFHTFAAWPRLASTIDRATADWHVTVGDALSDQLHLHAFFACGAFARSQSRQFEPSSFRAYLSSKQSAIVALRHNIATEQFGKSTVLAIMHMVALEHQAGQFAQAISIQRGAKTIIERLGSDVQWKPHEMAFITDIWLSVDDMEFGCFAPEAFDPGPWNQQASVRQFVNVHEQAVLPELDAEFHEIETDTKLSDLFAAIRDFTVIFDWMHETRSSEERSRAAIWLQMRATATKRRLMNHLIRAKAASQWPTGWLRENLIMALCNSAVCYVCFAFIRTDFIGIAPAGPQSFSSQIVNRVLQEAELAAPEDRDDAAMLWILFVLIAQQQYSRPDLAHLPEVTPFKHKFADLLTRLRCTSWLQAKRILQRYLYRPQLMDGILREIFNQSKGR